VVQTCRRSVGWIQLELDTYAAATGCRSRLRHAAGQHGDIALIERFVQTMQDKGRRSILVSRRRTEFRRQLDQFIGWQNTHRPHVSLEGKTPNEVHFHVRPANRRPRLEPRKHWPCRLRCAGPRTLIARQPGDRFTLEVHFYGGMRHVPIVAMKCAG